VSPGLPGAAWQLLVRHQRPGTQFQETPYQFCMFRIISLIINIISIVSIMSKTFYIKFVSLSPFSSFFPSSGGRVGFNREHLPLCLLPPWSKP